MDKAEFVERAPIYYALAIAVALERSTAPMPEFKIRGKFLNIDETIPGGEEREPAPQI